MKLTAASVLTIQVQDAQKLLSQTTKDGRRPDLSLGVWGPKGLFYPAHASGGPITGNLTAGITSYSYRLAVPRDTALKGEILDPGTNFDSGITVSVGPPYGTWIGALIIDNQTAIYGQVNALLTAPLGTAIGPYDVQLASQGTGTYGFVREQTDQSTTNTNPGGVKVSAATPSIIDVTPSAGPSNRIAARCADPPALAMMR